MPKILLETSTSMIKIIPRGVPWWRGQLSTTLVLRCLKPKYENGSLIYKYSWCWVRHSNQESRCFHVDIVTDLGSFHILCHPSFQDFWLWTSNLHQYQQKQAATSASLSGGIVLLTKEDEREMTLFSTVKETTLKGNQQHGQLNAPCCTLQQMGFKGR